MTGIGWTVETLKQHLEKQFDLQKEAVETALVAAEKAVTKAETAAEKRFESVNEFRAQLTDQASTFVMRKELDVRLDAMNEKIDVLAANVQTMTGQKAGSSQTLTLLLTMGGLFVAIIVAAMTIIGTR